VTSIWFAQLYGFRGGSGVTSIEVTPNHPLWSSQEGVLFDKGGTKLIQYPLGRVGDYTIPQGVTSIDQFAFAHSTALTGLTIPSSVRRLEMESFENCTALTYVNLPEGLDGLSTALFYGCSSLKTVRIPDSAKGIGPGAFAGCISLRSLVVGKGLARIEPDSFRDCNNLDSILFLAEPPSLSGNPFVGFENLVIYHLPNASFWTKSFFGIPTTPFVPKAGATLMPAASQFSFTWTGTGSIPMTVERRDSLLKPWVSVSTNIMSRSFTDSAAPANQAFYRAVLP
jgi:hypothetical protein